MDFDFGTVDDVAKVPEAFRPLYAKGEDGTYGVDERYQGIASSILGLSKSLKAARADARNSKVDLSPLADYGDSPEAIRETVQGKLKELQDQLSSGAKQNLEKVRQEMAERYSKETQKLTERANTLQAQLNSKILETEIFSAARTHDGEADLLLPFVRDQVRIIEENGKVIPAVVDAQGDRRYSSLTGQAMTIEDLVAEMKSTQKFARFFNAPVPRGGGGMHPGSPSTKGGNAPKTSLEKIASGLQKMRK